MNQGLPVAGKEVGLMYSFSSQSDDGFSAPDAAARDLSRRETKWKNSSKQSADPLEQIHNTTQRP